jgi:hypothetical protein
VSRRLWTNRHAIGAARAQKRAPAAAIVTAEGGGRLNPTLFMGGGTGTGTARAGGSREAGS